MQIGYFLSAIATSSGEMPHTVVTVRPLANLPGNGIEPVISITVPIPSLDASARQIGEDALQLARRLVPESSFVEWAQNYADQMQRQAVPTQPISYPPEAGGLLADARFPPLQL